MSSTLNPMLVIIVCQSSELWQDCSMTCAKGRWASSNGLQLTGIQISHQGMQLLPTLNQDTPSKSLCPWLAKISSSSNPRSWPTPTTDIISSMSLMNMHSMCHCSLCSDVVIAGTSERGTAGHTRALGTSEDVDALDAFAGGRLAVVTFAGLPTARELDGGHDVRNDTSQKKASDCCPSYLVAARRTPAVASKGAHGLWLPPARVTVTARGRED
jgi:hypothetical protein